MDAGRLRGARGGRSEVAKWSGGQAHAWRAANDLKSAVACCADRRVRAPPLGPSEAEIAADAARRSAFRSLDALVDEHRARSASACAGRWPLPARAASTSCSHELRGARPAEPGLPLVHRDGLPRHVHPAGHPAQRAREPGLVHGLHAVPGRDRAGPARGAAQLPDHGRRTSPACRWPTRRCSTRPPPPPRPCTCATRWPRRAATPSSWPRTATRRRSRSCGRARSRSASTVRVGPADAAGPLAGALRRAAPVPGDRRPRARPRRAGRPRARGRRPGRGGHATCWR